MGTAMRKAEGILFGTYRLDRAAALRADAARLRDLAAAPGARALCFWRGKALVAPGERAALGWLPLDHDFLRRHGGERVFLGLDPGDGGARFAIDVSAWEAPDADPASLGSFSDRSLNRSDDLPGLAFADLRAQMAALDPAEAGIAATGKGILGWHATHGFCARCGSRSVAEEGGWRRACAACGAQHFPRTDPVVIMLVTAGERVLLGRQAAWPPGMHSLLAGFVEPGETIEAAVRRETREEAGITVGAVTYLASQPWPFPSSLMIGCHGEALDDRIRRDPQELEAATWVSREALVDAMAGRDPDLRPPRQGSIARFLLARWLEDALT
jgi:NAD+ diphosphatase